MLDNVPDQLAVEVQEQYRAAFLEKERQGLHANWTKFEDYWAGNQNPKKNSDHPGSVTNIIMPSVESMVADLVMEPLEILVKGWTATERAVAPRAQLASEWIWEKNKMIVKRDRFERQRSKFGTGVWKIYFDGQSNSMLGMPIAEPINPANFFPDPKLRSADQMHMCDYVIHAVPRPRTYLKRTYGSVVNDIRPDNSPTYNTEIFGGDTSWERITGDKVLVLERWTIEGTGQKTRLRKVVTAQNTVLYDSDKDSDEEKRQKGYYRINRYPFIMVPCYQREGTPWGIGDVEFLIPTQDLINDLDDQIRMNARLMGNIQKVISIASGINPKLWTNDPGLNIPARDVNGYKIVQPPNMPSYILNRRQEALNNESQIITGRSDVVEGRRAGSVRAASAIIALQEAGLRRVNHKKLLTQQALGEVFSIILDYVTEYWEEEREIGEEVTSNAFGTFSNPIMFSGKELRELPILTESGDPLLDDQGQPMTRRATFDTTVNIGAGFISSKAYIYQATTELVQYGIITREEGRAVLKEILGWPMIDPWNAQGEFAGQTAPPNAAQQPDQQQAQVDSMNGGGMGAVPPEMLAQLVNSMGGGNMPNG